VERICGRFCFCDVALFSAVVRRLRISRVRALKHLFRGFHRGPDIHLAEMQQVLIQMKEHGRSNAFIAARHQLTLLTVEVMLREEIRMRSVRASRRP
jgi:hypothetical protein